MKTISCGVIILYRNKILACKPYGKFDGRHDIPKGQVDEGESYIECAIRETREETGLELKESDLVELGHYKYMKDKDLHLFKCELSKLEINDLKCTSYFELNNTKLPEIDGYYLIPINESEIDTCFYRSLSPVIKQIFNIDNKK